MASYRVENSGTGTLQHSPRRNGSLQKNNVSSRLGQRDHANMDSRAVERFSSRRARDADALRVHANTADVTRREIQGGDKYARNSSGRQFTVGNIGGGGRIYLRPVPRPAIERPRAPTKLQPPFIFPGDTASDSTDEEPAPRQRPTSSTGRESLFPTEKLAHNGTVSRSKSQREKRPSKDEGPVSQWRMSPSRSVRHGRSHSFSTIDDHPRLNSESGTFKVVIHRPSISKTAEHSPEPPMPVLEVPIPHYRLGTPQFGAGGRAILRNSSFTRSMDRSDARASNASNSGYDRLLRSSIVQRSSWRENGPLASPPFKRRSTADPCDSKASLPSPSLARHSIVAVAAQIFDALSLRPDELSVVRYAPNTKEIIAATPSRLVAHITSPNFLDYELLSDFFLTYRSFLQPDELVSFLVSRLRWAVDHADDFGRIVRVRTFVALRHWILNYFVDDFLANLDLRAHFCDLVNGVYEYLRNRSDGGAGDIKIIGELKRCWRRTIALYWGSSDSFIKHSIDQDITPGGELNAITNEGSMSVRALSPAPNDIKEMHAGRAATAAVEVTPPPMRSRPKQQPITHAHKPSIVSVPQSMPFSQRTGRTEPTATAYSSPSSETSPKVLSCSLPGISTYRKEHDVPLFPHPIPITMSTHSTSPTMTTAKAPFHSQGNRAESIPDGARDSHQPSETSKENVSRTEDVSAMYIVPGSLVRGILYQPGSPYFDMPSAGSIKGPKLRSSSGFDEQDSHHAMRISGQPSPGVKRFLGSVRKAWGNKHAGPADESSLSTIRVEPAQGARSTNTSPDTLGRGTIHTKAISRVKNQVRVDLLAAKIGEAFKKALQAGVEEDEALDRDILAFQQRVEHEQGGLLPNKRFDRSVTVGSRSIVIVDDTQPELPLMSGAIRPTSGAQDTTDLYERYVDEVNRPIRDLEATRATSISIDGVLLGHKNKSSSLVPPLEVYMPTGLKRSSTVHGSATGVHPSQTRRFTNSSATSTLRRYASYHSGDGKKRQMSQEDERRSSTDSDNFILGKPPPRQLRRRPGGDLRAVDKVHDLAHHQHRRNSTGSSMINSIALPTKGLSVRVKSGDDQATPKKRRPVTELDEHGNPVARKSISLIQTHSSQPNLRPSFEAEVAKLAALPDDDDDDGGIEAALLKLEGRYEKKTPTASPVRSEFAPETPVRAHFSPRPALVTGDGEERRKLRHHKEHVEEIHPIYPLPPLQVQSASIHHPSMSSGPLSPGFKNKVCQSISASENSFNSVPLLQRNHSSIAHPRSATFAELYAGQRSSNAASRHVFEGADAQRVASAYASPGPPTMHESFLFDAGDGSDAENEAHRLAAATPENVSQGVRSFFDADPDDRDQESAVFMHPLRHPDTPPDAIDPLKRQAAPINTTTSWSQGLPTPGLTPVTRFSTQPLSPISPMQSGPPISSSRELGLARRGPPAARTHPMNTSAHLPFILAYDVEVLAQQFTLVEKDALDEIDWRELIELRWTQASPAVHNWVDYLKDEDPRGVDLVIARFNVVVKWLLSEIVLTDSREERTRCLVQYIRIADHCRKIRNFATMYQLTIAMLSTECSRLQRSWDKVPEVEMAMFRELEKLVQPLRNFQTLRKEMEMSVGDEGCIPFIGIYTRDLVYNSQKPAIIETPPLNANEPLINFERHQTAAAIVKSLLRLLEASSRYNFQVEPEVITKCLWMAALSDEEISKRSRLVEN